MSVGIIDADVPSSSSSASSSSSSSPNDAPYTVDFDLDFNLDVNLSINTIWNETNPISDSILSENFSNIDDKNPPIVTPTAICDSTFNAEYFSDSSNTTPVTSDLIWNAFGIDQFSFKNLTQFEDTTDLTSFSNTSDLFIYQTDDDINSELKSNDYAETLSDNCGYDILKDSLFELDLFGETLKDIDGIPATLETATPPEINPPIVDWNRRRSLLYDKNEFIRSAPDTRSHRRHQESVKIKNDATLLLNNHSSKVVEEQQRSYRCSVRDCDKTYCKASHLKSHMRRHSGFKPFACDWEGCKWRFSRSDELARHKRSHSGIKPYSCDLCDKAFSRSDHLSKHSKVHMKKLALYGTPIITKKCNYKYLNTNRIKVE